MQLKAGSDEREVRSPLHARLPADEPPKSTTIILHEDEEAADASSTYSSSEGGKRRRRPRTFLGERGRGRPGCCVLFVPPLICFFSGVALCGVRRGYFHQHVDYFDNTDVKRATLEFTFGWAAGCVTIIPASSDTDSEADSTNAVIRADNCSLYTSFGTTDAHEMLLAVGGFSTGALHMLSTAMALALTALNFAGFWDPLLRAPALNLLISVVGVALGAMLLAMSALVFPLAVMDLLEVNGSVNYIDGDYGYTMSMLNALLWLTAGLVALYGKITQSASLEDDILLAEQEAKWELADDRAAEAAVAITGAAAVEGGAVAGMRVWGAELVVGKDSAESGLDDSRGGGGVVYGGGDRGDRGTGEGSKDGDFGEAGAVAGPEETEEETEEEALVSSPSNRPRAAPDGTE